MMISGRAVSGRSAKGTGSGVDNGRSILSLLPLRVFPVPLKVVDALLTNDFPRDRRLRLRPLEALDAGAMR